MWVSEIPHPQHPQNSGCLVFLMAESDWRAIQETLHLLNIPGMRESIRDGLAEPIEDCAEEIDL